MLHKFKSAKYLNFLNKARLLFTIDNFSLKCMSKFNFESNRAEMILRLRTINIFSSEREVGMKSFGFFS